MLGLIVGLMVGAAPVPVDRWILDELARTPRVEVIVLLREQADLGPARFLATKAEKGLFVYGALKEVAERTQGPLRAWFRERWIPHRSFLIVNGFWARIGREDLAALAARPEVGRIEGNPWVRGLLLESAGLEAPASAIEPGIAYTNAPLVWALGFQGQGVVVGGQDTGYQWDHPALIGRYRGWNGSVAGHDHNWHDSIHTGGGSCGADAPAPCDDHGHGTHTMGTVLGLAGANQIGMAPGAQWIGVRNMDQGNGSPATYLESFEWFLAPYPVGGTPAQGNPLLAPDLTTNSWACPPSEGCTYSSLHLAVMAERAAGIVTVAAAGNSGPSCSSVSDPPAIHDEVFTVGAHRHDTGALASFSSRGPVTVDGSGRLKPDIAAPGVSIRSSVPGGGYQSGWSGTSMAAPHVAGAVALLLSAHPALVGQVDLVEQVLRDTAVPVASVSCTSSGVPNNLYGYGRLDVHAAVLAVRQVTVQPSAPGLSAPPGGTAILALTAGNAGYLDDTVQLSAQGNQWPAQVVPASVVLPAGQSTTVHLQVLIPSGVLPGAGDTVQVTATSQNFVLAQATTLPLAVAAVPLDPQLALTPVPGAGLRIDLSDLVDQHQYRFIVSPELCPGPPGTGPYLGLCAADPSFLIFQFGLPLGTIPFHFQAAGPTAVFGPYALPSGTILDAVCFDLTQGMLLGVSPVVRATVP
jgi:serine protease AprX